MKQLELGRILTALRKEKNLTQEELTEKSNVSVRTIQRIEAGEVMPRKITIRILMEALGENFETLLNKQSQVMKTQNTKSEANPNTLLTAVLAGAVYLIAEIILGSMDIAWFQNGRNWGFQMNSAYVGLTIIMVVSYMLFARGFIALSSLFENTLLKIASYLLIVATAGLAILDVSSLSVVNIEDVWAPYTAFAIILGVISILFGVSLLRLQDGMGELSRVAGVLEIVLGCLLLTVFLFFLSFIILIPATIVEILLLYRGYEYLTKSESVMA